MRTRPTIGDTVSTHIAGMGVQIGPKMQRLMLGVQQQIAINSAMKESKKSPKH